MKQNSNQKTDAEKVFLYKAALKNTGIQAYIGSKRIELGAERVMALYRS